MKRRLHTLRFLHQGEYILVLLIKVLRTDGVEEDKRAVTHVILCPSSFKRLSPLRSDRSHRSHRADLSRVNVMFHVQQLRLLFWTCRPTLLRDRQMYHSIERLHKLEG